MSGLFCWQLVNSLDADGAFENFHGSSADARNKFLPALRDFYFDVAWPAHFRALKNAQRVARRQFSVSHKIRAQRTGGGARRADSGRGCLGAAVAAGPFVVPGTTEGNGGGATEGVSTERGTTDGWITDGKG